MHLLRFDTLDGVVYAPADRVISMTQMPREQGAARTRVCVQASDGVIFNLDIACEVDELAAAMESGYRACEVFRIIA
jgi:hypothetical protein